MTRVAHYVSKLAGSVGKYDIFRLNVHKVTKMEERSSTRERVAATEEVIGADEM